MRNTLGTVQTRENASPLRSECQFFMHPEDEAEFLAHASARHALSVVGEGGSACLVGPQGSVQFLRSHLSETAISAGRIAIATTGLDGECLFPETSEELERAYRELRRWLQKRYSNDLVCFNECAPLEQRVVAPCRNVWLGPHTLHWLETMPGANLRQFIDGPVIFSPASRSVIDV